MAAPVGHLFCAWMLLKAGTTQILDNNAFLAGTSFPDIRYIAPIERSKTHFLPEIKLRSVLDAKLDSDFEKGRRFHAYVDKKREAYMREHNAYRFFQGMPLKTQLLKLAEDHILFPELKTKIDAETIFGKIYKEEQNYGLNNNDILAWHRVLKTYLNPNYWFDISRYAASLLELKDIYDRDKKSDNSIWDNIRTTCFFIYAYFKVLWVSHDEEFRALVNEFYHVKFHQILQEETHDRFSFYKNFSLNNLSPLSLSK